jgi:glutathione S-transferase
MRSKTSHRVGSESAASAISVSVPITRNRVVAPRFNRPVNEEAVVKAIPNARICIAEIGRLLDGHTWLAGDLISVADLLLAPHTSMFALAPEGAQILREHENLSGWLARIEARPSMIATTWDRLLERVAAAA